MDNRMNIKSNDSSAWPYIIVGSAVGGALGYLFMTESGRKVRHSLTHPDELSNNIDDARGFVEEKMRMVTDRVHGVIHKARHGIEEGQLAYREAGEDYRSRAREYEAKHSDVTSKVHASVDKINRSAVNMERSVLDPICEMGALVRGIERGIRVLFGKTDDMRRTLPQEPPYRVMGS
jgi:hypothetical protein